MLQNLASKTSRIPTFGLLLPASAVTRPLSTSAALRQASSDQPPKPPPDHEYQAQYHESPMVDLAQSYSGVSEQPFSEEITEILLAEVPAEDIEVLPGSL